MLKAAQFKTKAELALEMGRSMAELRIYLRQFIQEKIRQNGIDITFEMLEVMGCLWKKDGVNQQEIADITLRDKSSMTYLIDNLVKRGLVKRTEDEADRRNKLIYLTPDGLSLREQLQPWVAQVYNRATADVSIDTLEDNVKLLQQMITNLKADK